MKKGTIVAIVCWSLAAVLLLGVMITAIMGGLSGFSLFNWGISRQDDGTQYSVMGEYKTASAGIENIEIDWSAGGVDISPYDGEKIYFEESAAKTLRDEHKLFFEEKGGTLTIQYVKNYLTWNIPHKHLTVKVPRQTAQKLSRVQVKSTSEKVDVNGLTVKDFHLQSVSGELSATDINSEKAEFSTTSGEIRAAGLQTQVSTASSVSGDIYLAGGLGDFSVSTTSGEVEADAKTLQSVSASTVSGDVTVKSAVCPENMRVNTTSGDIKAVLPENAGFTAAFSSVSGDFSSDFPTVHTDGKWTYKDGAAQFSFNTTSGDAEIKK